MSYPAIREACGESSPQFYAFRQRVQEADAAAALRQVEDDLAAAAAELQEHERRKLRLLVARRWKML